MSIDKVRSDIGNIRERINSGIDYNQQADARMADVGRWLTVYQRIVQALPPVDSIDVTCVEITDMKVKAAHDFTQAATAVGSLNSEHPFMQTAYEKLVGAAEVHPQARKGDSLSRVVEGLDEIERLRGALRDKVAEITGIIATDSSTQESTQLAAQATTDVMQYERDAIG